MNTLKHSSRRFRCDNRGVIALMAMVIVAAIGVVVITGLLMRGTGETHTALVSAHAAAARALAEACAERALNQLRLSPSYAGGESLTLPSGSCQVVNVLGSGTTNRAIQTSATVSSTVQKLVVVVSSTQPRLEIASWKAEDF